MDCTTKIATQVKQRTCRCYLANASPPAYIDSGTDADFDKKCQPCVGEYEKTEECQVADCVPNGDWTAITDETKFYKHHHCCEDSAAFRV